MTRTSQSHRLYKLIDLGHLCQVRTPGSLDTRRRQYAPIRQAPGRTRDKRGLGDAPYHPILQGLAKTAKSDLAGTGEDSVALAWDKISGLPL